MNAFVLALVVSVSGPGLIPAAPGGRPWGSPAVLSDKGACPSTPPLTVLIIARRVRRGSDERCP